MLKLNSWLVPMYESTFIQPKDVPKVNIKKKGLSEHFYSAKGPVCINWSSVSTNTMRPVSSSVEGDKLVTTYAFFVRPKKYRTRTTVGETAKMPKALALITQADYLYALSFKGNEQAHLQLIAEPDKLIAAPNGVLYYDSRPINHARMAQYYTNDGICDVDIPLLMALYSVIWKSLEKKAHELAIKGRKEDILSHCVKMYLPDFLTLISGKRPSLSEANIERALEKIDQFSKIVGIIEENGYKYTYPLMSWLGHSEKENIIYFSSPYINMVIMQVLQASVKRDKNGNPMINKAKQPILLPTHSYLIKPELSTARNKRAAELVCAIVALIERAGHLGPTKPPHICAETLVERCPRLAQTLKNTATTSDKNKVLRRAFEGAWKLLPTCTNLKDYYPGIKLPSVIPTMATLDTLVLEFPHKGKNKTVEPAKC